MAQVTYLLGAGASAECIPVVAKMEESFDKTFNRLVFMYGINLSLGKTEADKLGNHPTLPKVKAIFDNLKKACKDHYSIDTYAKKLYLTDKAKFLRLKMDLSFYLTLVQLVNPIDKRYDNMWASFMSDTVSLPNRVKIISWNYDFQVERSYQNMTNVPDFNSTTSYLRYCCPLISHPTNTITDDFCFIKLNGSARLKQSDGNWAFMTDHNGGIVKAVTKAVQSYLAIDYSNVEAELQFAWEESNNLLKHIKPALATIEVLVIIGYSFPFFNRRVDSELLKSMQQLKTIYIQDIQPDVIKESLEEIIDFDSFQVIGVDGQNLGKRKLNIICKDKVSQFVFPKELEI